MATEVSSENDTDFLSPAVAGRAGDCSPIVTGTLPRRAGDGPADSDGLIIVMGTLLRREGDGDCLLLVVAAQVGFESKT